MAILPGVGLSRKPYLIPEATSTVYGPAAPTPRNLADSLTVHSLPAFCSRIARGIRRALSTGWRGYLAGGDFFRLLGHLLRVLHPFWQESWQPSPSSRFPIRFPPCSLSRVLPPESDQAIRRLTVRSSRLLAGQCGRSITVMVVVPERLGQHTIAGLKAHD